MKERIFYDADTGRHFRHHSGCIPVVRVWTGQMVMDLRRWYATTTNNELAEILGVSTRSVQRVAKKLGLQKDADWLCALRHQSLTFANHRNRILGGRGRFQPGNTVGAKNWFKYASA